MDMAVYIILLVSFLISTFFSIWVFNKKANKWVGILIGFCSNAVVLSIATFVFYKFYHFKEGGGLFSSLGILVFAFFIPVISLIHFYIIEFLKNTRIKTK